MISGGSRVEGLDWVKGSGQKQDASSLSILDSTPGVIRNEALSRGRAVEPGHEEITLVSLVPCWVVRLFIVSDFFLFISEAMVVLARSPRYAFRTYSCYLINESNGCARWMWPRLCLTRQVPSHILH